MEIKREKEGEKERVTKTLTFRDRGGEREKRWREEKYHSAKKDISKETKKRA